MNKTSASYILTGLAYSILWASASVAGKIGIRTIEPLTFFTVRFLIAGAILLLYTHALQRSRLPQGGEWKQVTIFGAFNTTLYLGIFIIALQYVTPGITTLAIALNPLFISIMSALVMKRKVRTAEWISIALGIAGVGVAAYPLLLSAHATPLGLVLIALSMIAYSVGSVYYADIRWELSRITVNAWQVFIGGLLLAPVAFAMHHQENHFNTPAWLALAWLVVPVSILAVQLWLRLLKSDAVRASLWLYLCPVFGFLFAFLVLQEPLTVFTFAGTVLVLAALYIGQRKSA